MNYQEAMQHALKVEWKVSLCHTGENCWCRVIEPKVKILNTDYEEIYIVGDGCISKEHAIHIVNVHNKSILKKPKTRIKINPRLPNGGLIK